MSDNWNGPCPRDFIPEEDQEEFFNYLENNGFEYESYDQNDWEAIWRDAYIEWRNTKRD